jgi:hypothetical protein
VVTAIGRPVADESGVNHFPFFTQRCGAFSAKALLIRPPNGIPRQRRFNMKFTRTLLASALVALLAACSNGAQDSAQDAQKSADQAQGAADQAQKAAADANAAAPAAAPASTAAAPATAPAEQPAPAPASTAAPAPATTAGH